MRRHLVTGATGFLGGALVLELLAATPDEVVCLVRAGGEAEARRRLLDRLRGTAADHGLPGLGEEAERRCRAVAGDITRPCAGVAHALVDGVDEVWHAAASLRYLERHATEIAAANVGGTGNVLELTRQVGATVLNHVSTAYVAGSGAGAVPEAPPDPDTPTHNAYERTKLEAELLVASAPVRSRILRPSIVIGHSRTHAASSSFGLYGALLQIVRFQRRARERLGGYLRHYRAQVLAEGTSEVNLVPVDLVARNAVRISLAGASERVFHLVNASPPTVADIGAVVFPLLGMREPALVPTTDTFTALDHALDRGLDFYAGYLRRPRTFVHANTVAVCGPEACRFALDRPTLRAFLEWYLERYGIAD